jgi:hypothetical protein
MRIDDFERRWIQAVDEMEPEVREALLRILTLSDDERVGQIGRAFESGFGPGLGELLIDLEEEPAVRHLLIVELRGRRRDAGELG